MLVQDGITAYEMLKSIFQLEICLKEVNYIIYFINFITNIYSNFYVLLKDYYRNPRIITDKSIHNIIINKRGFF